LIDWLRGSERAKRKYDELRENPVDESPQLSISVIGAYELQKGAKLSKNAPRDLKLVHDLISELATLELDSSVVDVASELYSELSGKGKRIGEFDILIAATCIASNQALVTNDSDFDKIANLVKVHY
jgi:tRNA(fMet)-specific endonuclease VapC